MPARRDNPASNPAMNVWLPDMDLNHDKQIQSLLCYRYTIGQTKGPSLLDLAIQSRATPP